MGENTLLCECIRHMCLLLMHACTCKAQNRGTIVQSSSDCDLRSLTDCSRFLQNREIASHVEAYTNESTAVCEEKCTESVPEVLRHGPQSSEENPPRRRTTEIAGRAFVICSDTNYPKKREARHTACRCAASERKLRLSSHFASRPTPATTHFSTTNRDMIYM